MMKKKASPPVSGIRQLALGDCLGKPLSEPACGLMKFSKAGGQPWSSFHPVLAGNLENARCVLVLPPYESVGLGKYAERTQRYIFINDTANSKSYIVSFPLSSFVGGKKHDIGGSHLAIANEIKEAGKMLGLGRENFPKESEPQDAYPLKVGGGEIEFKPGGRIYAFGTSGSYKQGPNDLVSKLLTELHSRLQPGIMQAYEALKKIAGAPKAE
ncbi:MAG: hypothetical protein WC861_01305 [Candidatus Micrarchaeia archaeon]|jgi:hypothetical protein